MTNSKILVSLMAAMIIFSCQKIDDLPTPAKSNPKDTLITDFISTTHDTTFIHKDSTLDSLGESYSDSAYYTSNIDSILVLHHGDQNLGEKYTSVHPDTNFLNQNQNNGIGNTITILDSTAYPNNSYYFGSVDSTIRPDSSILSNYPLNILISQYPKDTIR